MLFKISKIKIKITREIICPPLSVPYFAKAANTTFINTKNKHAKIFIKRFFSDFVLKKNLSRKNKLLKIKINKPEQ